jgi:hypothetical protein
MNKKLQLLTILLTVVCFNLWGQSRIANPTPDRKVSGFTLPSTEIQSRAETDTLLYPAASEDCGGSVTSFTITGQWGYLAGTNGYGDLEKAQRLIYTANTPYNVIEVWAFFSDAAVKNNGNLRAKVYAIDAATDGPGVLLGESDDIKTADIETDPMDVPVTIFPFTDPATVTDDEFFVSIDMSDLYAAQDTVGLFQTDEDCGSGDDAWELFSDGTTWVPINDGSSWGLEANWALGAVVEFGETTDVNDPFVAQKGLRLFPAMPNPASNWVDLPYQIEASNQVYIEVYSADGKLLQRINKGQQLSGRYAERFDIQALPSGTYVYGIITDQSRIMSRFVVGH